MKIQTEKEKVEGKKSWDFEGMLKFAQTILATKDPRKTLLNYFDQSKTIFETINEDSSTLLKALVFYTDNQIEEENLNLTYSGPELLEKIPFNDLREMFKKVLQPELYSNHQMITLAHLNIIGCDKLSIETVEKMSTSNKPTVLFELDENETGEHPFDKNKLIINIGAKIYKGPTSKKSNYIFILDKSSSMEGKKLERAIRGFAKLAEKLPENSKVSLIAFNHNSTLELKAGTPQEFIKKLNKIEASGGTSFISFFKKMRDLEDSIDTSRTTKVLFATDGDNLDDNLSIKEIFERIVPSKYKHLKFYSIGFGNDYNEGKLSKIGNFFETPHLYVKNSDEELNNAIVELTDKMGFLEQTVTLKVSVQVDNNKETSFELRNLTVNGGFTYHLIELDRNPNNKEHTISGEFSVIDGFLGKTESITYSLPTLRIPSSKISPNAAMTNLLLTKDAAKIYGNSGIESETIKELKNLLGKFGTWLEKIDSEKERDLCKKFYEGTVGFIQTLSKKNNAVERKAQMEKASSDSYSINQKKSELYSFDFENVKKRDAKIDKEEKKNTQEQIVFYDSYETFCKKHKKVNISKNHYAFEFEKYKETNNSERFMSFDLENVKKDKNNNKKNEGESLSTLKKYDKETFYKNPPNKDTVQFVFIGAELFCQKSNLKKIQYSKGFSDKSLLPQNKEFSAFIDDENLHCTNFITDTSDEDKIVFNIMSAFHDLINYCEKHKDKKIILVDNIAPYIDNFLLKTRIEPTLSKINGTYNNVIWVTTREERFLDSGLVVRTIDDYYINVITNIWLRWMHAKEDVTASDVQSWFYDNSEKEKLNAMINYRATVEQQFIEKVVMTLQDTQFLREELNLALKLNLQWNKNECLYKDSNTIFPTSLRFEFGKYDIKCHFRDNKIYFREQKENIITKEIDIASIHPIKFMSIKFDFVLKKNGPILTIDDNHEFDFRSNNTNIKLDEIKNITVLKTDTHTNMHDFQLSEKLSENVKVNKLSLTWDY